MFKFQFLHHTISPILANKNTFGTGCALVWFGNFDNKVLTEWVARQDNNQARGARRARGLRGLRRRWGMKGLRKLSRLDSNLKSWPNLESRPGFNFIASTKHQRKNTNQTPASKSCLSFNFKNLTKPCAHSMKKTNFMSRLQLPNLQQTVANTFLIIRNSNNLNKFLVAIYTRQGHINQVY